MCDRAEVHSQIPLDPPLQKGEIFSGAANPSLEKHAPEPSRREGQGEIFQAEWMQMLFNELTGHHTS